MEEILILLSCKIDYCFYILNSYATSVSFLTLSFVLLHLTRSNFNSFFLEICIIRNYKIIYAKANEYPCSTG